MRQLSRVTRAFPPPHSVKNIGESEIYAIAVELKD